MGFGIDPKTRRIELGKFSIKMPNSRKGRIAIGSSLAIGGVFGFLPILGFWMTPLGLLILSHDLPSVRRLRRRIVVWLAHRKKKPTQNR